MSRHLVVAIAAAAVLAGCTTDTPPTPTPSASSTQSEQSATPSSTPSATPTPSPEPSATWTIPADWSELSPADAGVDTTNVRSVVGAWELPNGAVASIVTVANDSGTTDPEALYDTWFADFAAGEDYEVQHAAVTTHAGEPALTARVTPVGTADGDSQDFIIVLRPDVLTWATVSDTPAGIDDSGDALWDVVRLLPAA